MSALELQPTASEDAKPSISAFHDLEAETGKHEYAAQIAVLDEPALLTPTEQANHDFYLQVQQIAGVQVRVSGGDTWGERTIVVVVPDLLAPSADDVFNLEIRIADSYPSARLNVQVWEAPTGV